MSAVNLSAVSGGNPKFLGATPLDAGTNFSFYAGAAAQGVTACVYRQEDPTFERRYVLTEKEPVEQYGHVIGHIWYGVVPGAGVGDLYGFRVDGPFAPENGHFFNPNKLLVDPSAREVTGSIHTWDPRHFPDNREDNAELMPKGRIVDWQALRSQAGLGALYAPADRRILELHVKGATCLHPDIPAEIRGTYKALCHPAFVGWLKDMGFTSIELMPIGSFGTDMPLAARGLTNYWGYMKMAPMAPHTGYAATSSPLREFCEMVAALRHAGIEVILDIVPNHTLESGLDGPVVNLRGMDTSLYFWRDDTGAGNTVNFGHPMNRFLFLSKLLYWRSLGVSGFRIDLATIIGREHGKDFDPNSPMMRAIREHPDLGDVWFSGEPWDLGPNGVQIGRLSHRPPGSLPAHNMIAEWDACSHTILPRAAFGHIEIPRSWIMNALAGQALSPNYRVVHFCKHDGPPPADSVSTETGKNNLLNGENNRDGNDIPIDFYWASPEDQLRVQRLAVALLAITQGVPMMTLGHERCKTQGGNTNPYCQDNEISYINWNGAVTPEGNDLMAFTKSCNAFRAAHSSLRRGTLFTGKADPESGLKYGEAPMKDVTWLDPLAGDLSGKGAIDWLGGFGMMLSGDPGNSPPDERNKLRLVKRQKRDSPLLALINPTLGDIEFTLPDVPGIAWTRVLNSLDPAAINDAAYAGGQQVTVGYKGMIAFEGKRVPVVQPMARPVLPRYAAAERPPFVRRDAGMACAAMSEPMILA